MEARGSPGLRGSKLFTVRVWLGSEEGVVRGEVREVTTGAATRFRRWEDLEAFLEARLKLWPAERD